MLIAPLEPAHAAAAARLHILGQPGTFLTSLGPDVLAVLYRTLPVWQGGFGFVALGASEPPPVLGFVSATTSVGGLFIEMGTRRLGQLLPPLLATYARHPRLVLRSLQTTLYPLLSHGEGGADAELLSIMVEPAERSRGVGALLMQALLHECINREFTTLAVTVDAANPGARRFYARYGFELEKEFRLYGRGMCSYRKRL